MTDNSAEAALPPLVGKATALARRSNFDRSCSPETGQLLRVLAAQCAPGVIGEIGTGCGVGSAWIASGLRSDCSLVTVELDAVRADAARRLLASQERVSVICGDWQEIVAHGPFVLLFVDAAVAKQGEADTLLKVMRMGGLIVLDDLTPPEHQPAEWRGRPDPVRERWLRHPEVVATEVRVRETEAVLLAVKTG